MAGIRDWYGADSEAIASNAELERPMQHVATREWHMACNWKVFCDNVLVRKKGSTSRIDQGPECDWDMVQPFLNLPTAQDRMKQEPRLPIAANDIILDSLAMCCDLNPDMNPNSGFVINQTLPRALAPTLS